MLWWKACAKKAGYELVKSLKISTGTMSRIMKPMGDFKENAKINNAVWKTCISEGVTVKEFYDRKMTPRPDSLETFMLILPMGVNSKALGDIKAICHFLCNSSQKKCKNNTSMLFSKRDTKRQWSCDKQKYGKIQQSY